MIYLNGIEIISLPINVLFITAGAPESPTQGLLSLAIMQNIWPVNSYPYAKVHSSLLIFCRLVFLKFSEYGTRFWREIFNGEKYFNLAV